MVVLSAYGAREQLTPWVSDSCRNFPGDLARDFAGDLLRGLLGGGTRATTGPIILVLLVFRAPNPTRETKNIKGLKRGLGSQRAPPVLGSRTGFTREHATRRGTKRKREEPQDGGGEGQAGESAGNASNREEAVRRQGV